MNKAANITGEIRHLTALRGIFAVWVMGAHIALIPPNSASVPVLSRGYLAVDFFFALSGFVLARTYAERISGPRALSEYGRYVVARAGRLFPLHLIVLACIVAVLPAYPVPVIVDEALLMQRWHIWPALEMAIPLPYPMHSAINPPDWSISTEWAVNLALPAFTAIFIAGGRWRAWAGSFICGAALVLVVVVSPDHNISAFQAGSVLPLVRCAAWFGLGIAAYRIKRLPAVLTSSTSIGVMVAAIALALIAGMPDLLVCALVYVCFVALTKSDGAVSRALSIQPLHFLGEISYSIYLTHYLVALLVFALLRHGGAVYALSSATVTILLSCLTYRFIERPARSRTRAIFSRPLTQVTVKA